MSAKLILKDQPLTQGNPWKNIAASNVSKNFAFLIFLPYFKNKYFLEHLTMVTSGNVTKYAVLHQYDCIGIYMVYWHIMVDPVNFFF